MKKNIFFLFLVFTINFAFPQAPAGYYNGTTGLLGAALKTKLSQIITNGHVDHGYNGLWTGYQTTDRDNFYENDGTVLDIYSENPTGADPYNYTITVGQCGTYNSEGDCYNREHVVPQSLFSSNTPMLSDIHFIRPTDGHVNGMRSNFPFGVVGTASFTSMNGSKLGNSVSAGYSGTVFEPINAFKGDIARMIFYFVTRYESQLSTFSTGDILGGSAFPGLQNWELQQLLIWNAQDPVSAAEVARNNASYTYQGNRNPFIDNPQWAIDIWGTTDTIAPTSPTNVTATNPTSSSVNLSWTAATDNIGVVSYDIYVNGVYYTTVSGSTISTTISGLNASTNYTFYVIAKDLTGNPSVASNTATATTLAGPVGGSCGSEDFENVPTTSSGSYGTKTWTNNSITWTATDARSDQTITNKAITVQNGKLTSSTITGGITSLTVKTQRVFSGGSGSFNLKINGNTVGTIPYSALVTTTTINNINVSGNIVISFEDKVTTGDRVSFDDLSWTCYTLGTNEANTNDTFEIYPNPVTNNEIYFKGEDLNKISVIKIYTISGRLIQVINHPFNESNKILLKKLPKGTYILKADSKNSKFIVQ